MISLTKYENIANGDVTFDVSKFDYRYWDDLYFSELELDFDWMLENWGDMMTIIRQTTSEDTMGNIVTLTEEFKNLIMIIQDISKKDREINEMGLGVPGNSKLYVRGKYEWTSGGVSTYFTIKEGDILIDRKQKHWRIIKIVKEWFVNNVEVYKICVIQSIDLQGSG